MRTLAGRGLAPDATHRHCAKARPLLTRPSPPNRQPCPFVPHLSSLPATVTTSGLATTMGGGSAPRAAAAAAHSPSSCFMRSKLHGWAALPSVLVPRASVPWARINSACEGQRLGTRCWAGDGGSRAAIFAALGQAEPAICMAWRGGRGRYAAGWGPRRALAPPPPPRPPPRGGAGGAPRPRPCRLMAPRAAQVKCRQRGPSWPAHQPSGRSTRCRWVTSLRGERRGVEDAIMVCAPRMQAALTLQETA